MEQLFVNVKTLELLDYCAFSNYCRSLPQQWSITEVVHESFASELGFKILTQIPTMREVEPWETSQLIARKSGMHFYLEWLYKDLENAEEIKQAILNSN